MLLCIVATSLLHIIAHYYFIITSLLRHYYKLIIQRGNHVKMEPFPLSPIITHYYIIITKGHHYYLINLLGGLEIFLCWPVFLQYFLQFKEKWYKAIITTNVPGQQMWQTASTVSTPDPTPSASTQWKSMILSQVHLWKPCYDFSCMFRL